MCVIICIARVGGSSLLSVSLLGRKRQSLTTFSHRIVVWDVPLESQSSSIYYGVSVYR